MRIMFTMAMPRMIVMVVVIVVIMLGVIFMIVVMLFVRSMVFMVMVVIFVLGVLFVVIMIRVLAMLMVVVVFMLTMVVPLEQRAFAEFKKLDSVGFDQRCHGRVTRQMFDCITQPRRQVRPHPKHKICLLYRGGF